MLGAVSMSRLAVDCAWRSAVREEVERLLAAYDNGARSSKSFSMYVTDFNHSLLLKYP